MELSNPILLLVLISVLARAQENKFDGSLNLANIFQNVAKTASSQEGIIVNTEELETKKKSGWLFEEAKKITAEKEKDDEWNTKEKGGDTIVKERDGEIKNREIDGEIKTTEKDGEIKTKEKDDELRTKDKDGEMKNKDKDGEMKTKEKDVEMKIEEKDGELKTKEKDGELKTKEKEGERKIEETDGELKTKEKDGEIKTKEKDGELNTKEKDGELKTKEKDGELKTKEKDGELNIKEKDGELKTKEKDGELKTKEKDGELNTKEKDGELKAKLEEKEIEIKTKVKNGELKTKEKEVEIKQKTIEKEKGNRGNKTMIKVKSNQLKDKLTKLLLMKNETKIWFPAEGKTCQPQLSTYDFFDKQPSSLCVKGGKETICYCQGAANSKKYKMFCGSCILTFKPEIKKKQALEVEVSMEKPAYNNILMEVIAKIKRQRKIMRKEWTLIDDQGGCENTKLEPIKFYQKNPSVLCEFADENPCLCVRNSGEKYEKICGLCSRFLKAKPVQEY